MASPTRWSTQKSAASAEIKRLVADGQEKDRETLVTALRAIGLTEKNALKAIYAEMQAGSLAMSGTWSDAKFRRGA